jgi:hypothetical protein
MKKALGGMTDGAAFMSKGSDQGGWRGAGEVGHDACLGAGRKDGVDAAMEVLAVGTNSCVRAAMKGAAGVIVGDDGRIKIKDGHLAVGSHL